MSVSMRAKVRVTGVTKYPAEGPTQSESLSFLPVAKPEGYGPDGLDEDNTYAKWSPSGAFTLTVTNPALFNKFKFDERYYVDFTPAEK
jgi:hypothetical protein